MSHSRFKTRSGSSPSRRSEIGKAAIVFGLTLVFVIVGCRKGKPKEIQDLNSVRADLREQVANGKLTREEAVVKLAEATKEAKFDARKKAWAKKKVAISPELEAFGKDLKGRVEKGEMTEAEAKAAWAEATGKGKKQSQSKGKETSAKGLK